MLRSSRPRDSGQNGGSTVFAEARAVDALLNREAPGEGEACESDEEQFHDPF
jgi:hypothetical protein